VWFRPLRCEEVRHGARDEHACQAGHHEAQPVLEALAQELEERAVRVLEAPEWLSMLTR
jgi:hypothetical protein